MLYEKAVSERHEMPEYIHLYRGMLTARELSEHTVSVYVSRAMHFVSFLRENGIELSAATASAVSPVLLTRYAATFQSLKPASRNLYTEALRSFLRFLRDSLGFPVHDGTGALHNARIHIDEEQQDARLYSDSQKQELDSRLSSGQNAVRNRAICALLLGSGLRVSELCSLNLSIRDTVQDGWFYCLRKGGNRRRIAVSNSALPLILAYLETQKARPNDAPLFISRNGNRMSRALVYSMLSLRQRQLGLSTGPHTLRHNFISNLAASCGNIDIVRRSAGHASVTTTQRYMHTAEADRVAAVRSMK